MKEFPPLPPQEEDPTQTDGTKGTRNINAVPELIVEPKTKPPLRKGTVIDPDFRIDLTAPDAHEHLDKLADEIAERHAPDPGSYRDNEYPTEQELEQEKREDEAEAAKPKDPLLEAHKGPPGGISDEKAKKLREENSLGRYDEDGWDEPTRVDPPKSA
jgi:hypothetical protein